MLRVIQISLLSVLLLVSQDLLAQKEGGDVFTPIAKYIVKGDAESLSAWFDDSLDLAVDSQSSNASKSQAQRILKAFFEENTPQTFTISHNAERANMKYALGSLNAGGRSFDVVIFVSNKGNGYKIQQLKIHKL